MFASRREFTVVAAARTAFAVRTRAGRRPCRGPPRDRRPSLPRRAPRGGRRELRPSPSLHRAHAWHAAAALRPVSRPKAYRYAEPSVAGLPPALRELVAYRMWESLHSGETWPLSAEQLEQIRRRAAELMTAR